MNWNLFSNIVTTLVIPALGLLIHKAVKTSNDAQRAVSLSKIAEGIAAIVVIQNPNASWAILVQNVVEQLKVAPNNTTSSNPSALNRAAAAALIATGVKPPTNVIK